MVEPIDSYPSWVWENCHCRGGQVLDASRAPEDIVPRDCPDCQGNSRIARHVPTGTFALYPGGPLLGRERP